MRHIPMALSAAALAGLLLGCQSENTNRRAEESGPTYPFTPKGANTRPATQPLAKAPRLDTAPKIIQPPPMPLPPPDGGQFDTSLVKLINDLRANSKQPPLAFSPVLTRVAQNQSKRLAQGMQGPDPMLVAKLTEAGYKNPMTFTWTTMSPQLNAAAIFAAMAQNNFVVSPDYRDVGIGIDTDAAKNYHVTVLFGVQK